jgi:hypothetical protein
MRIQKMHIAITLLQRSTEGERYSTEGNSTKLQNIMDSLDEGCINVERELGVREAFTSVDAENRYANAMIDAAELRNDIMLSQAELY